MIKAILFDLDGTLINTNDLIIKSFQYTFKKHLNLDIDSSEITKMFGEPLGTSLARYDRENTDELIKTYKEFNEKNHDILCKAFEGINSSLKELKALGLKIAVVTSKRERMATKGLRFLELIDLIDVIVTPECTEKHKPNGDPALKACELLGIKPEEAIMVGDSYFDILCGRNAGCYTAVVNYSELSMDLIKSYSPNYYIDNIKELVGIAEAINKQEAAI